MAVHGFRRSFTGRLYLRTDEVERTILSDLEVSVGSDGHALNATADAGEATQVRLEQTGFAALGEAGVTRCLEILRNELDLTMAFCGHTRLVDVTRDILLPGTYPV